MTAAAVLGIRSVWYGQYIHYETTIAAPVARRNTPHRSPFPQGMDFIQFLSLFRDMGIA